MRPSRLLPGLLPQLLPGHWRVAAGLWQGTLSGVQGERGHVGARAEVGARELRLLVVAQVRARVRVRHCCF